MSSQYEKESLSKYTAYHDRIKVGSVVVSDEIKLHAEVQLLKQAS